MICNKKAYPDLRKDCATCSERDACFSGHAAGVALAQPILQDATMPLTRERINSPLSPFAYKDELEKALNDYHFGNRFMMNRA